MCGQGLNPFTSRSGQNVQDLLKDNKNSGIAVSFILFFWGGGGWVALNGVGVGVYGK